MRYTTFYFQLGLLFDWCSLGDGFFEPVCKFAEGYSRETQREIRNILLRYHDVDLLVAEVQRTLQISLNPIAGHMKNAFNSLKIDRTASLLAGATRALEQIRASVEDYHIIVLGDDCCSLERQILHEHRVGLERGETYLVGPEYYTVYKNWRHAFRGYARANNRSVSSCIAIGASPHFIEQARRSQLSSAQVLSKGVAQSPLANYHAFSFHELLAKLGIHRH